MDRRDDAPHTIRHQERHAVGGADGNGRPRIIRYERVSFT
jgi:hypothetical protein